MNPMKGASMGYRLVFDAEQCQGYANCLIEAPALWDFDEDANQAVLLNEQPGEEMRALAEATARGCPAQAIRIEELPS